MKQLTPLRCVLAILLTAVCTLSQGCKNSTAAAQDDKEWVFDIPAKESSRTYERPKGAEYFWWDTDEKVQVELVFEDGTKITTGSAKEFSKKVVSVKFINPENELFQVKLWARF